MPLKSGLDLSWVCELATQFFEMLFQLLMMVYVATQITAKPAKEMTVAKSYTGWDWYVNNPLTTPLCVMGC